jgi:hypothetical protein
MRFCATPSPKSGHTRMAHGCRFGWSRGCGHASTHRPCTRHRGRSAAVPHRTAPGCPRMPQDAAPHTHGQLHAFCPRTPPGPRGMAKRGTPDMRLSLAPTGTRLAHPPRRARMPQDGSDRHGDTAQHGDTPWTHPEPRQRHRRGERSEPSLPGIPALPHSAPARDTHTGQDAANEVSQPLPGTPTAASWSSWSSWSRQRRVGRVGRAGRVGRGSGERSEPCFPGTPAPASAVRYLGSNRTDRSKRLNADKQVSK